MHALGHQIDRYVIWQMLQPIPSHEREIWITVGMALKAEFGEKGFSLFDEWSNSANNYDYKSVTAVWRSFKGGAVSIGSLIHLAKEHGWRSNAVPNKTHSPNFTESLKSQTSTSAYGSRLWLAANKSDSMVGSHQYAKDKGIDWAAGAGRGKASGSVIGKNADCLIVPIHNIQTNRVQGVQCINLEGCKQTFGGVSGGALILGNTLDKSLTWYVTEGWASAVSMVFHHQNGNGACASSFGKSNQHKTAKLLAEFHQPREIIILEEVD